MVAYERTQLRKRKVAYHLMDKPPPKGHPDWKRVVAVIVQVRRGAGGAEEGFVFVDHFFLWDGRWLWRDGLGGCINC